MRSSRPGPLVNTMAAMVNTVVMAVMAVVVMGADLTVTGIMVNDHMVIDHTVTGVEIVRALTAEAEAEAEVMEVTTRRPLPAHLHHRRNLLVREVLPTTTPPNMHSITAVKIHMPHTAVTQRTLPTY